VQEVSSDAVVVRIIKARSKFFFIWTRFGLSGKKIPLCPQLGLEGSGRGVCRQINAFDRVISRNI
jgi:hypothetical protein